MLYNLLALMVKQSIVFQTTLNQTKYYLSKTKTTGFFSNYTYLKMVVFNINSNTLKLLKIKVRKSEIYLKNIFTL